MASITDPKLSGVLRNNYKEIIDEDSLQDFLNDTSIEYAIFANEFSPSGIIDITKDVKIFGSHKSFRGGTRLNPSTNATVFRFGNAENSVKCTLSSLLLDCDSVTSAYVLDIQNTFLSEITDLWIKDSTNGINVGSSNSVHFINVMVMEDSDGTALFIGEDCNNISFKNCNFETNTTDTGGNVTINGLNGVTFSSFDACQIERSTFDVVSGSVLWTNGKLSQSSKFYLRERASSCFISGIAFNSVQIQDFGFDTKIEGVRCSNIDTPLHYWPTPTPVVAQTPTYGAINDEYVFLVTAGELSSAAASNCTIDINDGAGTLASSNTFAFDAEGTTQGQALKPTYTFLFVTKSTSGAQGPVFNNCDQIAIRGGESVLPNATALNLWAVTNDCSVSGSAGAWVITPTNTTWGIGTVINAGLLTIGKRYIAVAKWDPNTGGGGVFGNVALCIGNAWNGADGGRPIFSQGIDDLYGDGDTVAMLSFEYTGQAANISLGSINSTVAITARWVAMIEA